MSQISATPMTEGAPPRSTRQLLDELDALMDKMLALPVEDEPAPSPKAAPEASASRPTLAATLTLIEPEDGVPPPSDAQSAVGSIDVQRLAGKRRGRAAVERKRHPQSLPRHTTPAAGTAVPHWTAARNDIKLTPEPAVAEAEERLAVTSAMPVTELLADTVEPPVERESRPLPKSSASWLYGTIVIWERAFRRFSRRLGPLGWLLRTGVGRTLLGLTGLGLWLVALGWLLRDWM